MATFTLKAEVTAAHRWRWVLEATGGAFVDDHEVELDPADPMLAAYCDLPRYLRSEPDPRRPLDQQRELLEKVGRWAGEAVLGQLGRRLVAAAPSTVIVRVDPDGKQPVMAPALQGPLEVALVDGKPLITWGVTFVHVPTEDGARAPKTSGDTIRILAVFSLPDDQTSLMLREQRRRLSELVANLRAAHGRSVELTVLQWATTREVFRDALEDGRGWDVVHFSGHGLADGLMLETAAGGSAAVPLGELIPALRATHERLKLVVLSSCHSAGAVAIDRRPALLPPDDAAGVPEVLANLAEATVRETGAAVLAMRYSVASGFLGELADGLYDRMLRQGHSLSRALQLALPLAIPATPTIDVPPLSVATPALFGKLAADLVLAPREAKPTTIGDRRMAHFPPEPRHLVGRSREMSTAATALDQKSGRSGVLFVAPVGSGTSTCAVELAYRHAQRFRMTMLYHEVMAPDGAVAGTLTRFAEDLETQAPGLGLAAALASGPALDAYLPRLTETFEQQGIILVVDGIDVLLSTSTGSWRDPRWGKVVAALLDHKKHSRTILAASRRPQKLSPGAVVVELAPLTPVESALFARQLPTIGSHLRGRAGLLASESRDLVARLLTAAGGSPALIEAADADPAPPPVAPSAEYLHLVDGLMIGLVA